MQRVMVRMFDLDEDTCVDALYRRGSSFALKETRNGVVESWRIMSREEAALWCDEAPEQVIEVMDLSQW